MKISEVCIQRPVLSWVLTLALILLGLVGGSRLSLQHRPNVQSPFITIESHLPGAAPQIVESRVTRIIEEQMAGMEGMVSIASTSAPEESKIMIEFAPERRMDDAANDIRDRLSRVKDRLPQDMADPTLIKSRAEDRPIITLALTSDTLHPSILADYATRELQKELESLKGVARVEVNGAGFYNMLIKLDPVKLAAYKITVPEVRQAILSQNVELPAGKLISSDREYLITTVANVEKPEEFNVLPIATREGHLVLLQDIGTSEITSDDKKTRTRFNGKPGISLNVTKQSTANLIDVARSVKNLLPTIREQLPPEMTISIGSDRTIHVERSIDKVYASIAEAVFLVVLVVFVFLRSARASLIPLVTIPVSLIGVMFFMYLMNFSINTFTLMAMVLAIGLVVDDAIVVLENVHRYLERGMKPFQAAIKGIREISFSIVAMTLTLVAVYAPIALVPGTTGKLFTEFALTLAGAVFISGFAALTLSPMMCARMLKTSTHEIPSKSDSFLSSKLEQFHGWKAFKENFLSGLWLTWIEDQYDSLLQKDLKKPLRAIIVGVLFALFGYAVFTTLPSERFPREDQGMISIDGQANQSATLEHTDRYVAEIDKIVGEIPEVDRRVIEVKNPTYDGNIQLKEKRARSTKEIEDFLTEKFRGITGVSAKIDVAGSDDSDRVKFVIQGRDKTPQQLRDIAKNLSLQIYRSGIVDAMLAQTHGDTEDYVITINRDKATSLNIPPKEIAETIETLFKGRKTGEFKKENKMYDVKVEVEDKARQTPRDITNLFLRSGNRDQKNKEEQLVPLTELITVHAVPGEKEIYRYGRMRSVSYTAALKPGIGLGQGIKVIKELAAKTLPNDVRLDWTDDTKRYLTESSNIILIFSLAIGFIYLVMAAQFESWVDPFIIMLSVPLSLAGAVITLALIKGGSMNLFSQIGLVTLIGLITKHGILMVDVANKLQDEGLEKVQAITLASKMRLRPILMTTFAMVLGAVPLALASGSGSENLRQIGWVIVGGMSIGTLFTLFVLPAIYIYLARHRAPTVRLAE